MARALSRRRKKNKCFQKAAGFQPAAVFLPQKRRKMALAQKQFSIFWTKITHRKRVFPSFHRVFNTGGKLKPDFSTIQHFSCGIFGADFLKFVYFGFFWKLKEKFWNSVIPFVYRAVDRNVENPVENVKNCGFYSPLFHTNRDSHGKWKN